MPNVDNPPQPAADAQSHSEKARTLIAHLRSLLKQVGGATFPQGGELDDIEKEMREYVSAAHYNQDADADGQDFYCVTTPLAETYLYAHDYTDTHSEPLLQELDAVFGEMSETLHKIERRKEIRHIQQQAAEM